ncbi:MAG: DUF697 domain-containing protein [Bacteroidetes bacterium]|nr:MAG: DUF697 domain-containing protein [Bacteroidota bacterium]
MGTVKAGHTGTFPLFYRIFEYACPIMRRRRLPRLHFCVNRYLHMLYTVYAQRISIIYTIYELVRQERKLYFNALSMQHQDKPAQATEIIRNHIGFSLGAALVPFPGADLLAVSAVQLNMLRQLAKLYNVRFLDSLGKTIISTLVGSSVARLGASLVKIIPGVGTVVGELSMPVLSGASTYAIGRVVANHLQRGGTLQDLDLKTAKKEYAEEIETGRDVADALNQEKAAGKNGKTGPIDKLREIAQLRDEGVITAEEFQKLKDKLLTEI